MNQQQHSYRASEMDEPSAELQKHRKEIDKLDHDIARLLEKRFEHSQAIGELKREHHISVEDARREIVVLTKVAESLTNDKVRETVLKIYRIILKESRDVQQS